MLGVLISILWQSKKNQDFIRGQRKYYLLALPFFLVGIGALVYFNTGLGNPAGHFLLAFFYADLLLLALVSSPEKPGLLFGNKLLGWLGLRSYGIYLLHKPVKLVISLLLANSSILVPVWMIILISTILLFGVAELSYRLIEKPIMNLGHHFKYQIPEANFPVPASGA
jgi:peptidoglycan/LPS O-acetylase OafA/YrhL